MKHICSKYIIGAIGDVALKKYDFSLSNWSLRLHRLPVVDIAVMLQKYYGLFLLSKPSQESDLGFFTRPFRSEVWVMILIVSCLTASILLVLKKCRRFSNTKRCFVFTSWIVFVLINAYYGSALTMFSINHRSLPFSNTQEALRYPEWKMIFIQYQSIQLSGPAKLVIT